MPYGADPIVSAPDAATQGGYGKDPVAAPAQTDLQKLDAGVPAPVATMTIRPEPPKGVVQRASEAAKDVMSGPWGVPDRMKQMLAPATNMFPVLGAPFEGMATMGQALLRVPEAAVRGAGAVAGGVAEDVTGNRTTGDLAERDVTEMGNDALLLGGMAPTVPTADVKLGAPARNLGARATNAAPAAIRWMWGVDQDNPDAVRRAKEVAAEGGRVPIETWAPASTFLSRVTQIAKGFGYDPVRKAGTPFYETQARGVLDKAGLDFNPANPWSDPEPLTGATAKAPIVRAGEVAVNKATEILDTARQRLDQVVRSYRDTAIAQATDAAKTEQREISTQQAALVTEADSLQREASGYIRDSIARVDHTTEAALAPDAANPGALMRQAEGEIRALRVQFGQDARRSYEAADLAAEGHLPNAAGLGPMAQEMLDGLLPPVRAAYPREVQLLARLAEEEAAPAASGLVDANGQPIPSSQTPEGPQITFGQLHELRNWLRHAIDYNDLAAGPKQGVYKLLESQVNGILHDQEAVPELRAAAHMLDQTDRWYGENITRFKDSAVKAIIKSGTAAAPENAGALASLIIKPGNPARIGLMRNMLGPETWSNVLAADMRDMVVSARDETGGVSPQKFASEIMKAQNDGTLVAAHGAQAARGMVRLAQQIQSVYGDFSVNPLPGDTVTTLMERAKVAINQAEAMAARDPLGELGRQTKQINDRAKQMEAAGEEHIRENPLRVLPTMEGEAAAQRILDSPDLIRATAAQFGPTSPEFTAIRQAWARRFMQREIAQTGDMATDLLKTPEDVQRLIFPGVSRQGMVRLAQHMQMIFPSGGADSTSLGLSGMGMMFHPANAAVLPHSVRLILSVVPTPIARAVVSSTLDWMSRVATDPRLLSFVTRGMDGSPAEKAAADAALLTIGGGHSPAMAVAAASTAFQRQLTEHMDQPSHKPMRRRSWQERLSDPASDPAWMRELQPAQ